MRLSQLGNRLGNGVGIMTKHINISGAWADHDSQSVESIVWLQLAANHGLNSV